MLELIYMSYYTSCLLGDLYSYIKNNKELDKNKIIKDFDEYYSEVRKENETRENSSPYYTERQLAEIQHEMTRN